MFSVGYFPIAGAGGGTTDPTLSKDVATLKTDVSALQQKVNNLGNEYAPKSLVTTVQNHIATPHATYATVKDNIWKEIQAYHMGNPLWLRRICTGLWIISDQSIVNTYRYLSQNPTYGYDTITLNGTTPDDDLSNPILIWREFWSRRKGVPDAVEERAYQIRGFRRTTLKTILPSATVPRGLRLTRDGTLASRMFLRRSANPGFTVLATVSYNTGTMAPDSIWSMRVGWGHLFWTFHGDHWRMELWNPDIGSTGQSGQTNVWVGGAWTAYNSTPYERDPEKENLQDPQRTMWAMDWANPYVRVLGVSWDTAQNKLAILTWPKVYEYVTPVNGSTPAIHSFARAPTTTMDVDPLATGADPSIIWTPHPEYTDVPVKVDYTEWKAGTYTPNAGQPVATPGANTDAVNPNGLSIAYVGFGALESLEDRPPLQADMNLYEVRTYDQYLGREALVQEAFSIYDTTVRRTVPPTVT